MKYNMNDQFNEVEIDKNNKQSECKNGYIPLNQNENEENILKSKIGYSKMNFFKHLNPYYKDIIFHLPLVLATIFYVITLQGCNYPLTKCLELYPPSFMKWVALLIMFCGTLYVLQILLYIYKYTTYIPIVIQSIIIVFLCFIYDKGTEVKKHGAYNSVLMFIGMIFSIIIISLILFLVACIRKKPIITILILLCITSYSIYKIKKIFETSCDYWIYGFKGTELEYSKDIGCNINPPKICYYPLTDGWFDMTRLSNFKCDGINSSFSNIEPYISDKTTKILGYPRTEKFKHFPDSVFLQINKNVMKRAINMEDPKIDQAIKDEIEITTNFYKNPPEVKIDLKYNAELVKQRKEIRNQYKHKPLTKNILTLFIDSLSRNNFKLKLPKFYRWIENYFLKNADKESYSKQKIESFQFLKFHGVGRYTAVNMVPVTFGVFNIYYSGKMYLKEYKDAGYIIGQSSGFCVREIFDLELGGTVHEYKWEAFDHEFVSLFCDTNFSPYDEPNKGTNSVQRRCIYGNDTITYAFEYLWQFFTKYKDEPKYFRLGSAEAHEGSTEVIKYSDDYFVEFFTKFEKAGFLDDTIFIIHSDHGFALPGPYSVLQTEDWNKESVLPSLFMLIPTNIERYDEIRDNLKHNEQSIITPFNLYNSYKTFLGLSKYKPSSLDKHDIFIEKLPKSRDCSVFYDKDYYDSESDQECRCSKIPFK